MLWSRKELLNKSQVMAGYKLVKLLYFWLWASPFYGWTISPGLWWTFTICPDYLVTKLLSVTRENLALSEPDWRMCIFWAKIRPYLWLGTLSLLSVVWGHFQMKAALKNEWMETRRRWKEARVICSMSRAAAAWRCSVCVYPETWGVLLRNCTDREEDRDEAFCQGPDHIKCLKLEHSFWNLPAPSCFAMLGPHAFWARTLPLSHMTRPPTDNENLKLPPQTISINIFPLNFWSLTTNNCIPTYIEIQTAS